MARVAASPAGRRVGVLSALFVLCFGAIILLAASGITEAAIFWSVAVLAVGLAVLVAVGARSLNRFLRNREEALAASERRYRLLFARNQAGLYRTTVDGRILECNLAFAQILGYETPEEVLRLSAADLYLDGADRDAALKRVSEHGDLLNHEICLRRKDGTAVWVVLNERFLADEGPAGVMEGSLIDITDRKKAEEESRFQASHDALTGLPNRLLFTDRLSLAILHAHRRKELLAVMFLDLDHFKHVNDTLGHSAGDQVLVKVAERVKGCLREDDTVARLGGDEFIVLISGVAWESVVAVLARKVLAAVAEPMVIAKRELFLTASIGIGLYPNDGTTAEALVANVDTAMYRAKELGRNDFQFFTPRMQQVSAERAALESGLRRALPRGEFLLHYQPILEMSSGRLTGAEALLRWKHPEKGLLPPRDFVALAEETGVIVPVGEWALRSACEQVLGWHGKGHKELRVAVNLSARQFQKRELGQTIRRILEDTGLPPRFLEVEITESIAMHDLARTGETLRELYAMGVQISVDDFGTGHSSLNYVKHFPVHRLKIDQSFTSGLVIDPKDRAIVAAIVSMAHDLRLKVTAEGVEAREQAEILASLGCDEVQGYLFGHPVTEIEFEGLHLARPPVESVPPI